MLTCDLLACFFFFFLIGDKVAPIYYVTHPSLELVILLPQLPEYQDYVYISHTCYLNIMSYRAKQA